MTTGPDSKIPWASQMTARGVIDRIRNQLEARPEIVAVRTIEPFTQEPTEAGHVAHRLRFLAHVALYNGTPTGEIEKFWVEVRVWEDE